MQAIKRIFSRVDRKQCTESGMVVVLLMLLLFLYFKKPVYVKAALISTLITLAAPLLFYPFAVLWFGLSRILAMISSAIIMSLIFFLVLTPMGLFRRFRGADRLLLKQFKKGKGSVMVVRDHLYTEQDFIHTF